MPSTDRPDILFITVDTMRRDCMAPYGPDLMPTATRLLAGGTAFDRAVAPAPWTGSSFGSILSGLWPRRHGCMNHTPRRGGPTTRAPLADDVRLLSEMLHDSGYHTACCQGNYGFLGPGLGFARGFDEYFVWHWDTSKRLGSLGREVRWLGDALAHGHLFRHLAYAAFRLMGRSGRRFLQRRPPMSEGGTLVRQARRLLHRAPDEQPVFLWVNLMDLHVPHTAPRKWMPPAEAPGGVKPFHLHPRTHLDEQMTDADRAYVRKRYENSARYADHCIASLLDRWPRRRGERPRLTVFASDHGEEFWDHGTDRADPTFYNCGSGHGHTLFGELIHVPFIMHWPGMIAADRRVDQLVSLVDLVPTLIDLLALDEDTSAMVGRSLKPDVTGDAPADGDRIVFADGLMYGPERRAAVSATHKLIRCPETGEEQLFAWGLDDPGDTRDLIGSDAHAEVRERLSHALDAWNPLEAGGAPPRRLSPDEEAALAERLGRLGYF